MPDWLKVLAISIVWAVVGRLALSGVSHDTVPLTLFAGFWLIAYVFMCASAVTNIKFGARFAGFCTLAFGAMFVLAWVLAKVL